MSTAFSHTLTDRLGVTGIIAVLVLEDAEQAEPLTQALQEGGVNAVELALRTPASLDALHRLRRCAPSLLLGAGTVLTPAQVSQVRDAGVDFAVSPGTNRRVLETAAGLGLPFAPGVCTASDIETALEYGCNVMKLFPAEPVGGLVYLKALSAPYLHLGIRYIPLGGIGAEHVAGYAANQNVLSIGGSWIAPKAAIDAGDWEGIARRGREAIALVGGNR